MKKYHCKRCKKLIKEEYTVLTTKGAELKAQGEPVPESETLHKADYRTNERNCDYVTAPDMIVREKMEVLIALKHNAVTLDKKAKMAEVNLEDGSSKYPDLAIDDSEYDQVEVPNVETTKAIGEDFVRVVVEIRDKDIQKTGIICPECYKPTDTVIWGVHKE
ncbi:hypothetical protein ES703_25651 [subsurface metagenome]